MGWTVLDHVLCCSLLRALWSPSCWTLFQIQGCHSSLTSRGGWGCAPSFFGQSAGRANLRESLACWSSTRFWTNFFPAHSTFRAWVIETWRTRQPHLLSPQQFPSSAHTGRGLAWRSREGISWNDLGRFRTGYLFFSYMHLHFEALTLGMVTRHDTASPYSI
jgi:hypothetical protein